MKLVDVILTINVRFPFAMDKKATSRCLLWMNSKERREGKFEFYVREIYGRYASLFSPILFSRISFFFFIFT